MATTSSTTDDLFTQTTDINWDVTFEWDNFSVPWENTSDIYTTESLMTTEKILKPAETPPITGTRFAMGIILSIVIPISLFANSVVIAAIIRTKRLQRPNTMMYLSLSLSDFLRTLLCMPFFTYSLFTNDWAIPEQLCPFYHAVYIMIRFVTVLNLAVISIERLIIITKPLLYHRLATKTRMFKLIAIIWSVSFIYGALNILWFFQDDPEQQKYEGPQTFKQVNIPCRYRPSIPFVIFDFLISFVIPLLIMFIVYAKIYFVVKSQMKRIAPTVCTDLDKDSIFQRHEEYSTSHYDINPASDNYTDISNASTAKHRDYNSYYVPYDTNHLSPHDVAFHEYGLKGRRKSMVGNTNKWLRKISEEGNYVEVTLDNELVDRRNSITDKKDHGEKIAPHIRRTSTIEKFLNETDVSVAHEDDTISNDEGLGTATHDGASNQNSQVELHYKQNRKPSVSNSVEYSENVNTHTNARRHSLKGNARQLIRKRKDSIFSKSSKTIHFKTRSDGSICDEDYYSDLDASSQITIPDSKQTNFPIKSIPTICTTESNTLSKSKHTQQWAETHFHSHSDRPTSSVTTVSFRSSKPKATNKGNGQHNKAVKLSIAVIGTFILCFAPYEITFIIENICRDCVGDIAWMMVNTLAFMCAAINPFVYSLYSNEFRTAMKKLFKCFRDPMPDSITHTTSA